METKAELLRELNETDRRMLELLSDLDDNQLAVPYDPGINPPVWEMGHAAFFYEYFLLRELGDQTPRMPGYDEIWDSFQIQHRNRWQSDVVPDKQAALDYYTRIIDEVRQRLETGDPDARERYLCKYGIGHQNMHLESMVWCRQTIGYPAPRSAINEPLPSGDSGTGDATIPAGSYPVGMPADSADGQFSFDAERPGHSVELDSFQIAKTLVTNGEFLQFIEEGGYDNPSLWSYRGKNWIEEESPKHPLYWRRTENGTWQVRQFDQWVELPVQAPVMHVNAWEAEAFCRWAGRRLPTELEWEAAARGTEGRLYPWGDSMDAARVDMDARHLGQGAVDGLPAGATPDGCLQMVGTAWEWTQDQFLPYDGFRVDMYPFMSTLQFGDHRVTKGGSCATSSCLIRSSYRQAYLPFRQDAFTGFRTCATM
ncbi:MAG: selenoneine synthase SenA [Planctomycetota bacterium]|jgi:iron(II)-dependent oxidoreductase